MALKAEDEKKTVFSAFHKAVLVDGGPENYNKYAPFYEKDHEKYIAHKSAADGWLHYHQQALGQSGSRKHKLFDAGCGTGLVLESMLAASLNRDLIEVHGGDLSTEMLEIARSKNIYDDLKMVNLKEHLPYDTDSFDSIVSAGVFLQGHCGPESLPNLVRVLKKGGLLIATARKAFYEETKQEWEKQMQKCPCVLEEAHEIPYIVDTPGVLLVIRKQ